MKWSSTLASDGDCVTANFEAICRQDELADPGAREFDICLGEETVSGVILHWQTHWYAYRNSCPHTGISLNWLPHQFFDIGGEFIQCSTHGALFRPEDGFCIRGPCLGRSLESLPVILRDGVVGIDTGGLGAS